MVIVFPMNTGNEKTIEKVIQDDNLHYNHMILKIPFNTKMNVKNYNEQVLELIVVKAPAPKNQRRFIMSMFCYQCQEAAKGSGLAIY